MKIKNNNFNHSSVHIIFLLNENHEGPLDNHFLIVVMLPLSSEF